MMKKRWCGALLALCLCLTLLPMTALAADATTTHQHPICGASCSHEGGHSEAEWTPVSDLSGIQAGTAETPNYYCLTGDVDLTSPWTAANNVVLCLNGHTIRAQNTGDQAAIAVNADASFTLTDCHTGAEQGKITHKSGNGPGVEVNHGTFTMNGGEITGNTANVNGGSGVYVSYATFTMNGGSITDNKGQNAAGVTVNGQSSKFTMTGGSITDNTAASPSTWFPAGAGVCLYGGTMTVSGNVQITGNKDNEGSASNVYFANAGQNLAITIGTGGLADGANIGVTLASSYGDNKTFTSGWSDKMPRENPADFFHSDNGRYDVLAAGDEVTLSPRTLTGTVSITGTPKIGQTLTAETANLLPTDPGALTYKWYRGDAEIPGATESTYTPNAVEDVGQVIKVEVSAKNCFGSLSAETASVVEKADSPAAPANLTGVACTSSANNDGKITGVTAEMEYSSTADFADRTACTGTEITDLASGTYCVRLAETATHNAGASAEVVVPAYRKSSSGSATTYTITAPAKTDNGSVTVSAKNARRGETVTVTATPDKGYTLETLTVLDQNGKEIKLTDKGDGKYTFTMPASKVEVKATFMDDNTMLNYFVDVKPGDFFYDAVLWAAQKSITEGTDAVHFSPNKPCTRAQIITFLWRAAGAPEPASMSSFSDVSAGSYYAKAVAWAIENGITTGTGDGKFSPDMVCSRAQAAAFLYRASGSPAVSGGSAFSDVAENAYYADAVAWAERSGVTEGVGGNRFGSGNDCTRAQIVTFLYRVYQGK